MCASAVDQPPMDLGPGSRQHEIQTGLPCSQEKEQPAFDASEFPALGGGLRGNVGLANGDSSGALEGSNNLYANLGMQKGMLPSEFNIQSEEFPALPGANAGSRTGAEDRQQGDQQQQQAQSNQVQMNDMIAAASAERVNELMQPEHLSKFCTVHLPPDSLVPQKLSTCTRLRLVYCYRHRYLPRAVVTAL